MHDPGRWLPRHLRDEVYEPARRDLHNDAARVAHERGERGLTRVARFRLTCAEWLLWLDCWRQLRHIRRDSIRFSQEPMTMIRYHLRHAVRLLWRDKTLTAAAVLTLALGLGANVAVFSVVEAVLLRPLPYPQAEDLVIVRHRDRNTGVTKAFIARGDFIDLAAKQQVFESLDSYGEAQGELQGPNGQINVRALIVSPGLASTLRARAVAGRMFEPADGRPDAAPVMMLSQSTWVTHFGSDPSVIGRMIRLGGADRQVIGIAPDTFRFPPTVSADVVLPIRIPVAAPAQRRSGWHFAVGRLKPGVTVAQADAHLAALSAEFEQTHPTQNVGSLYYAVTLRDDLVGSSKSALLLILAAVGLVLLVACANVANLLLARAIGRRPEMALRSTLGAGRRQLAVQLFAESLILGLVGMAAALGVAYFGVPALVALVPPSVVVPGLEEAGLNISVLAYASLATLATTIIFSLVGLATTGRHPGSDVLASASRSGVSRQTRRWSSGLVVAEIAFAAVLMVGAGLVLHSFAKLLAVDPGFKTDGVLMLDMGLPGARYQEIESRQTFYRRAFESLTSSALVESAGAAAVTPLTGNAWTAPFERVDRRVPAGQRPPEVGWQSATRGYFEALRIPLKSGRLFDANDVPGGPPVVIISDEIERQFFPGESAVGHRIVVEDTTAEIVGVVGSIRRVALESEPWADLYYPFEQSVPTNVTLFIKVATGDPSAVLPDVQARLRQIEPAIITQGATTLDDVSRRSIAVTRLAMWLLGAFAVVGLTLAVVGVYGVMAYQVKQRTREIGTRVALGATPHGIVGMIVFGAGKLVLTGLVVGLGAGVLAARGLGTLLFDVPVADPVTLVITALTIALAMAVASLVPARRAAAVDPARTLSGL